MKKYAIGFAVGTILTLTSAVYADDAVKALLFPAQFVVNGETKAADPEYATLNVNGHAYVPIRYIAENLGAVVAYDDATRTITVDSRFNVTDLHTSVRVGNLTVTKADGQSEIKGQLFVGQSHWDVMAGSRNWSGETKEAAVGASLLFYDGQGKLLKDVKIEETFATHGDRIKNFTVLADGDLTQYALVTLANVYPAPWGLPVPPRLDYTDVSNRLSIGILKAVPDGDFTRIHGWASLKVDGDYDVTATLHFYDGDGRLLGSSPLTLRLLGKDPAEGLTAAKFDAVVKGSAAAGYKSVQIANVQLEKANAKP